MGRLVSRLLVAALVLAACIAGVMFLTREKPVAVVMARVQRGAVERSVANTRAGTVKACRRAKLAPLVGGRVEKLEVKKGDRVVAGQLLLELWNEDLAAQIRLSQSTSATARARVDEACKLAEWSEAEWVRQQRLFADGVTSSQSVDRAKAEADSRASSCATAHAAVYEADRAVAAAKEALTRTVLRAPFDGVIADLTAELGEIVSPSPPGIPTPPAIDLVESGCLYILAPLDEVDAPRVKLGDPARVTLDAFPGESFPATVRRVASYVLDLEKQSRTVDVEVELNDPAVIQRLAPGYSADIEVVLETHAGVLRVPTESVMEGGRVYVLRDDRLQELAIGIGLSNWQYSEVTSGLNEGDTVVLSLDRAGVKAGAKVIPESSASPVAARK